jgi:fructokinase
MEDDMPIYGAIEAGGTKFNCLVGSGPQDIRAEVRIPTTTPAETLGQVIQFFKDQSRAAPLAAIGIGSFGPLDLCPGSPTYGYITSTVKPGWAMTDFVGAMQTALGLPAALDTDVNAAAYGEYLWGAAAGLDQFIYVTIGTGIGAGGMTGGRLMHGLLHPESGHMRLPHDLATDPFPGVCTFHGDCFEGLASGPSMQARWGFPAEDLPADSPAWRLEAHYIALAVCNLIYTLSPERVILGGGVMQQTGLFDLIRADVLAILNGYIQSEEILRHIERYIVAPGLGTRAGVLGALALASTAAN